MTFYDEMQQVASEILQEFDQGEIYYVEVIPGDGGSLEPGPSTEVRTLIRGAVARGVKFQYVNMGLAVAADLQVTIRADIVKPSDNSGFIDIVGERYKIKSVIPKPAAGTPAVYLCIVER